MNKPVVILIPSFIYKGDISNIYKRFMFFLRRNLVKDEDVDKRVFGVLRDLVVDFR